MDSKNLTTAKNPNGILPTLQTPEGTLTNTTEVIKYLVVHAHTGMAMKSGDATLVESLHSDALDPDFAKQLAVSDPRSATSYAILTDLQRNDEELAAFCAKRSQMFQPKTTVDHNL